MANAFKNLTMTGNHAADTDLVVGDFGGVSNAVATGSEVTVIGMTIANMTSDVISVSVKLFHNVTATFVVQDAPIATGGSLVVAGGDQKLVLWFHNSYGNVLKVRSNTVNSMNIVLSYLEST
jgi:hypothetical protein